jgi:hypothetical protein
MDSMLLRRMGLPKMYLALLKALQICTRCSKDEVPGRAGLDTEPFNSCPRALMKAIKILFISAVPIVHTE